MTHATTYTRTPVITLAATLALATIITLLSAGQAAATTVRGTLDISERIRLVQEEDRSLTFAQAKEVVLAQDATAAERTVGITGNLRNSLSIPEQIALLNEENRETRFHEVAHIQTIAQTQERETIGLGYHRPYVKGSVRANLTDAERAQLEREEIK